ncbi:hypothetical protein [Lyngbya aestuarii]|uniref:hypothetical protein n=1 Tax=Lyngbya aestuarii TaxID=118322 RepID=UPI00403D6682
MDSCSSGTNLGCQSTRLFIPLQALMASRKPGDDAFTPTPGGAGLEFSRVLALTCMAIKLSRFCLGCPFLFLASHLSIAGFRENESHLIVDHRATDWLRIRRCDGF